MSSCYRFLRVDYSDELRASCEREFVHEFMTWYAASKYGVAWYIGPDFTIRVIGDPLQTRHMLDCVGPSMPCPFTAEDCSAYHKLLVKFALELIDRTREGRTMQPVYMFAVCIVAAQMIGRYSVRFSEDFPFAIEIMEECRAVLPSASDLWIRAFTELHNT